MMMQELVWKEEIGVGLECLCGIPSVPAIVIATNDGRLLMTYIGKFLHELTKIFLSLRYYIFHYFIIFLFLF